MPEVAPPPSFSAIVLVDERAATRIGGMTLVERALFVLARAGAIRILCIGQPPPAPIRTPARAVTWAADESAIAAWAATADGHVVGMEATVVLEPDVLTALARAPGPDDLQARGPALLWRCASRTLTARVSVLHAAPHGTAWPLALPGAAPWDPPRGAQLAPARTPSERAAAERTLLTRLGRTGDSWLTRLVDRRVSRVITRWLAPTGVTPNVVSLVAIAIGMTGGVLFATGRERLALAGALLFLASTILDGCDGELARLTHRESRGGARLDLLGDNLVHLVLFAGIAVGLHRHANDRGIAILGVLLVLGVLLAMGVGYRCMVVREPTPAQRTLFETFASREFAYLLVLMTAAGLLQWFLWLSVFGTYAFAGGLLALGTQRHAPAG